MNQASHDCGDDACQDCLNRKALDRTLEELRSVTKHRNVLREALQRINLGRHGELNTVDMATIAFAALQWRRNDEK